MSLRHVAWLVRPPVQDGSAIERLFEHLNQFLQRRRGGSAQVVDPVASGALQRSQDTIDDIADVGVVAGLPVRAR